MANAANKFK